MDIITDYDKSLIEKRPEFNKIVNTDFASKILSEEKDN